MKTIYYLYRTNNKTNQYEYFGDNLNNAFITYILYNLYSNEKVRLDHTEWRLGSSEIEEVKVDGWKEYFNIDSFEIQRFEKQYPEYKYLLKELPEDIDKLYGDFNNYDKWLDYSRILEWKEDIFLSNEKHAFEEYLKIIEKIHIR